MEKETLFGSNSVFHLLVREKLKSRCVDVSIYKCGKPASKDHVTIHVPQVQHLERGDFSQKHSQ